MGLAFGRLLSLSKMVLLLLCELALGPKSSYNMTIDNKMQASRDEL